MPDNNMNQNNGNTISVNTSSIALFAADGTMLRFSFKNDRIIFTIIPKVTDEMTGKQKWPKELGHSALLPPATASALYNGIMNHLFEDIKNGTDHDGFFTVPLNIDCTALIGLSWVNKTATLGIFNNVNADRTCNNVYTFQFQVTTAIDNYDPKSGNFTVKEIQGQLLLFIETLKAFDDAVGAASAHTVKHVTHFNYNQIVNYLKSIAIKIGANIDFGGYGNYGDGSRNAFTGSGTNNSGSNDAVNYTTGYQEAATNGHTPVGPEIETITSLEDMMGPNY